MRQTAWQWAAREAPPIGVKLRYTGPVVYPEIAARLVERLASCKPVVALLQRLQRNLHYRFPYRSL